MAAHVCWQSTVAVYICLEVNCCHKCMLRSTWGSMVATHVSSSMVVANINYVLSAIA